MASQISLRAREVQLKTLLSAASYPTCLCVVSRLAANKPLLICFVITSSQKGSPVILSSERLGTEATKSTGNETEH